MVKKLPLPSAKKSVELGTMAIPLVLVGSGIYVISKPSGFLGVGGIIPGILIIALGVGAGYLAVK